MSRRIDPAALLHSIHFIMLPSGDLHPISVCEIFCVRINRLRESGLNGMFEGGWATERRELHFSEVQVPPPVCHVPASSLKEPKHVVLSWKGQCSRHFHRNQKFTETFRRFKLSFLFLFILNTLWIFVENSFTKRSVLRGKHGNLDVFTFPLAPPRGSHCFS